MLVARAALHRTSLVAVAVCSLYCHDGAVTGGNALKYYSSVRLDVRRKESLRDNSGITVKVKVSGS